MDAELVAALRTDEGAAVLAAAAEAGDDRLAAVEALRRAGYPAELAGGALGLALLRRRGVAKFGADAGRMFLTADGLQQATRPVVAERRARRLAAAGVRRVLDLCCGVGSDALAFARAGLTVTAVDSDPGTAAVAATNASVFGLAERITVRVADATTVDRTGYDAVFCDPGRRAGGRRVFDPAAYSPPWPFLAELAGGAACLKLGPGIDHSVLPPGAEAEWVSVGGEVVEAALWCGPLAAVPRRATVLASRPGPEAPDGGTGKAAGRRVPTPTGAGGAAGTDASEGADTGTGAGTGAAEPTGAVAAAGTGVAELVGAGDREAAVGPVRRYLYDPDGAVLRAHLLAELADAMGATIADPDIGYLYTDRPVDTPFARGYEVAEVLPFSLKRLRAMLRERGVGRLTIKKRGSALEPDTLRRQLRLSGNATATIVLTRVAGAPTAILCQPLRRHPTDPR